MGEFVHLHLHTEYSLLDGAVRVMKGHHDRPLREACARLNMKHVAITDHGNMYGVYTFVQSLTEKDKEHNTPPVHPIVGEEFYTCEDMYDKSASTLHQRNHLILLAKNDEGYHNLMKLSSAAFVDGFYGKPRIDLNLLAQHSAGLICCSACLAGAIPQLLVNDNYEGAKAYALRLKSMFADGDFYIELQDHGIPEEKKILNSLYKLSREIGVKVVATNDVHYILKEDSEMQDDMMCIQMQCKKTEYNGARFTRQEFYLKSAEEMEQLFAWCPEAISTTVEIAEKCTFEFQLKAKENLIPPYTNDEMNGRTPEQYLHDLAWERITLRYSEITDEIKQRLDYELGVICECGYATYFLIVWDYVNAAKNMGIPVGPGRGSGVGSIVAYSIGITDVDPLKFNLLFERFLSKERVSMPDFDIDFCFVRRPEIIKYVTEKYGASNVSQIIAYGTMKAKAAVKDVARIYDISYNDSNAWAKTIPNDPGTELQPSLDENDKEHFAPEFRKLYDTNPTAHDIIDKAIKIEGMPRQTSMHAAGVVICAHPVVDYVPLSRNNEFIVTQFDKTQVEPLGMLKMDFLGLKTLTDINEALKYIKADKGVDIDFDKLGFDDPKIYELIASGDCTAVFQLESGGMCAFMGKLKPTNIEDIIAGISIFRPGPIQFMDKFIEGKKHPESVTYLHPMLEPILSVTYGCMVYQEQVMQIARTMAGYSYGGADIMRRAIAKKKVELLMKQKDVFANGGVVEGDKTGKMVPGAKANGVSDEVIDKLFDWLKDFASYAFNKSHAAAYAVLSYQTAYLKAYYPTHLLTAIVNNRITSADEVKHYINYMRRIGIRILAPDINRSQKFFSIDGNDVRFGLMGIKNVGEAAIEAVLGERDKNGAFADIRDFFERCGGEVNSRMVESMILGGAFDAFGKTRSTLMASYKRIMDTSIADKKNRLSGQMSLFDFGDFKSEVEVKYNELQEYPKAQRLSEEKKVLGMYVSGHPLDDYRDSREFNFDTSQLVLEGAVDDDEVADVPTEEGESSERVHYNTALNNKQICFGCIVSSWEKKSTKKNQRFGVGILEDRQGTVEFSMFPTAYEKYGALLSADRPVKVRGKIDMRDAEPKITVDKMELWDNGAVNYDAINLSSDNPVGVYDEAKGFMSFGGNAGKDKAEQPKAAQHDVTRQAQRKEGILYLLVSSDTEKRLISGVLRLYTGTTPVRAQVKDEDGKSVIEEFPVKVAVSDALVLRLENIVGKANVKFVERRL